MNEEELQQLLQPYIDDGVSGEDLEIIKKKILADHSDDNGKASSLVSLGSAMISSVVKKASTITDYASEKIDILSTKHANYSKIENLKNGGKINIVEDPTTETGLTAEYLSDMFDMDINDVPYYNFEKSNNLENGVIKVTPKSISKEDYEKTFMINKGNKIGEDFSNIQISVIDKLKKNPSVNAEDFEGDEKFIVENFQKQIQALGKNNINDLSHEELETIWNEQQNTKLNAEYKIFYKSNDGTITQASVDGYEFGSNSYDGTVAVFGGNKEIEYEDFEVKRHYDEGLNVEDFLSGDLTDKEKSKFQKKLEDNGWVINNQAGGGGDAWGYDVIYIYKKEGDEEKTGLIVTLPTVHNYDFGIFTDATSEGYKKEWEEVASTINAHVRLHGTTLNEDEIKVKEQIDVGTDMIMKDLINVSNKHATIRKDGENVKGIDEVILSKEQKEIATILNDEVDEKMLVFLIDDLNKKGADISEEDKALGVKAFVQKHGEQWLVGYDWNKLLNAGSHWYKDTSLENITEHYKDKMGKGTDIFGREATADVKINWTSLALSSGPGMALYGLSGSPGITLGASSWEGKGEYDLLTERQIEQTVKDAIGQYVKYQTGVISEMTTKSEDIMMAAGNTNMNEIRIERQLTKLDEINQSTESGKAKYDLGKLEMEYREIHNQYKESPTPELLTQLQGLQAKITPLQQKIYSDSWRYGDVGEYQYLDSQGNEVQEENYDEFTGHTMSRDELKFYELLLEDKLKDVNLEDESIFTLSDEHEELFGNKTKEEVKIHNKTISRYEKVSNLVDDLSLKKWYHDNMRTIKGDYVINDYIAHAVLDELMKDPKYKDKIKLVGENLNGKIYNIEMGVLEEHYNSIIGTDGVRFLGSQNWTETQLEKYTRKFESPDGYFAPLDVDKFNKDFSTWEHITPYIPGMGGEADVGANSFTNMVKANQKEYIHLVNQLNVLDMMTLKRSDPATLSDEFWEETVDFFDHTGVKIADAFGKEYVDEEDRDDFGNYKGEVGMSARSIMDIYQTVADDAGITLSDVAKEEMRRSTAYAAWEGTIDFVPIILEFAVAEVALAALEVVTLGGATPIVAAAESALFARWAARILKTVTKGGKTKIFTPVQNLGRSLPGAAGRAKWGEAFFGSRKYYQTVNGTRLSEKQIKKIEKITNSKRGSAEFNKAVSAGDGAAYGMKVKRRWQGGIKERRNYLKTAIHLGYHGLREELKMRMVFDEHYHVGGGVAFFGVGKLLSKIPMSFTETSLIKGGNQANRLNSIVNVGRSGTAGMISAPTAQAFEAFLTDLQGGETFDFMKDMYPEITTTSALIDFLTFSMIGVKGFHGPKGAGWHSVRKLERLEIEAEAQMKSAKIEGYNFKKNKWTDLEQEQKYYKYAELSSAVKSKTDVIRNSAKWMDVNWAEKRSRKITKNIKERIFEETGKKVSIKFVNTAESLQKNKGRVKTALTNEDGTSAAAGFTYNKSTKKYEFIIDVSRTTSGKIPHELQHFLDRVLLENNPEAARRLKEVVNESIGDVVFWSVPKIKIVDGKEVLDLDAQGHIQMEDLTVNEMIERKYGELDTHSKNLEYLGYVTELLTETKNFHRFTKGGRKNSWKKLQKGIREWEIKEHGDTFDLDVIPKETKQQIINFFGEMAQASKKNKFSGKHMKTYKELGKSLTFDQPNDYAGMPWKGEVTMESLDFKEQIHNLESILTEKLSPKDFVESVKGLSEEQKTKRREAYNQDVKEIKDKISVLEEKINESQKDLKFEKDIDNIYISSKNVEEAAWNVAEQYDPRKSQSAGAARINNELTKKRGKNKSSYSDLPGFETERGNILNDLLTDSKRSIRQMVLDFDPNNKLGKNGERVPLSGWIGSILKKRGISESVSKFIKEGAKFTVEFEGKHVEGQYTQDAVIEYNVSHVEKGIDLTKALKIKPETIKEIEGKIENLDLQNTSFAKLKDLVPELTKEMFGKGPQGKAEYIAENWKTIYDLLPEGAMLKSGKVEIEGLSTQINPGVLKAFYKPTSRKGLEAKATAAKTGKTAGLKVQEKIEGLNKKQFLEKLGIKTTEFDGLIEGKGSVEIIHPKGSKEYRNTTETLFKGIIVETGRMVTNQVVREAIKKDKLSERMQTEYSVEQFDMILKAGKSDLMRSVDFAEEGFDLKEIKKEIVVRSLYLKKDKAHKFVRDSAGLMVDIHEKGINSVFDAKTLKLLPKYKGIPKYTSDFVLKELYAKGLILDKQTMGRGLSKILNKGVGPGERGQVLEQYHIDLAVSMSKEYPGLKVLTKKVAEGGIPDLHLELHGQPFNVEIKMASAQHGSITVKYNTTTGKYELTKKNSYIEEMMAEMIEETAPAWNVFREKANEFAKELGYKWTFEKTGDAIPPEVYVKLKEGGYVNDVTVVRPLDIKAVAEIYNNKEMPNFYINIQGKGLHYMGRNIHGLNVPELIGDAILTVRPAVTTVKSKARYGWKRLNYRAIPTIMSNTVKRSNYSIGNSLEFKDFMESPEVKRMEDLFDGVRKSNVKSAKAITGMDLSKDLSNIEAKKIIDTAIKAAKNGRKRDKERKGMSTWDFDDTLAITKSGVRAKIPNPSGKPKPGRKVVFLAGGAGSGKGNVIKKLGLEKDGFKIVNQDISLEWLKKNSGLPENMNDLTSTQRSTLGKLGHQARGIAKSKMMKYQGNAEGVVVDGTGGSIKAIEGLVKEFEGKGYDVSMLFVETSLETALARNKVRVERSLLDKIVIKNHEAVQENKSGFKSMFKERFMEVKTDNLKQKDAMPTDLVSKMNDFVIGYEKIRLDAEEFATQGKDILDKGGEFDFTEFDVVTKGEKGPFFQKALDRAKKFGTKHQYVLTARPPEAQVAIHEFLKSQGLNIPLKNIKGLGNSTGEAKALWMLEKFSEGYNDMYFADDAIRNVEAVKDVLSQLDVKSKVVQAKSINEVKDVNRLDSPDVYGNIMQSKSHREEYERLIAKHRLDLVEERLVSQTVNAMFDFVNNLNVPDNKKRKYEQITTKWLATSNIKLKEDGYKVKDAVELAERYKEDIFSYKNPNGIIEKYAGKIKEKPTDPKTVKEFREGKTTNKKHGIVEYEVANTKEGQQAVRKVMDSHFGEKSNPWCLAQKKDGKLTKESWDRWEHYSKGPKSLVFQNGKLIGFKANGQYWDRMDNATDFPVIKIKEGRVTKTVELVDVGGGKTEQFVMETRTTSKDKKTVTTEYNVERSLDAEGLDFHPAGTKIVENKINGITVKETNYKPNGNLRRISEFKNGKVIETRTFMPDGKRTMSINNTTALSTKKHGDLVSHEIRDGKTEYWFGVVDLKGKGVEIGFKTPTGFEVMDVMKRIDGKLRVDLNKLREIDPDIKGLPKEVVKPEGMRAIESIKEVLDQLDVKSETQQNIMRSADLNSEFNKIIEEIKGIGKEKRFSEGKAKQLGERKGVWKWWTNKSAEDFQGLVTYAFAGKGKQGEAHKKFFEDNLQKPFNRAYNEIHSIKQTMSNELTALRKSVPNVRKSLHDKVGNTVYTVDNAVRVYLWSKFGHEVPGLSKRDLKILTKHVESNPELMFFAEKIQEISRLDKDYTKPKDYWLAETITADLQNLANGHYRDIALIEFKESRKAIFGEWKGGTIIGDNMNKIEALYGTKHRENIEGMLWAMETGQNRPYGTDAITNKWMNWVNRAGGTIMFFNVKSAALQTISNINYMNGTFNNPFRAAQAFANQKQYWKDFTKIFNSDMLLQRRAGLKINIEASELSDRLRGKSSKPERALHYLLEKGFIPTKYADSFAIAMGGATFYRNRVRDLKKKMSKAEAEKQAWIEFTEITEATQQSSRPDFISAQQRSAVGRPILMFGNTPMQMFRRHKRRIQDFVNRRGNDFENIGSALYYGAIQTMIFSYLANAMFAKDEEDPDKEGFNEKKDARFVETILDAYLRGMGTQGATVAALKNALLEFIIQNEKSYNADYAEVVYDLLNISPPIGSKVRKIVTSLKDWKYNKEVIPKMGFHIDNPLVSMTANIISAATNVPLDRVLMKINNLRDASNSDYKTWERISLFMGVNRWSLDLGKRETVEEVKEEIKKEKKEKKTETKKKEKEKEEINLENKNKELQKKEKKEGKKDIKCAAISKSGNRCKTIIEPGSSYCTVHIKVEQSESGKEVQCKKIKQISKNKKERCKMMTNSKNGYCYYHD